MAFSRSRISKTEKPCGVGALSGIIRGAVVSSGRLTACKELINYLDEVLTLIDESFRHFIVFDGWSI